MHKPPQSRFVKRMVSQHVFSAELSFVNRCTGDQYLNYNDILNFTSTVALYVNWLIRTCHWQIHVKIFHSQQSLLFWDQQKHNSACQSGMFYKLNVLPVFQPLVSKQWRTNTKAPCGLRGCKNRPTPFPGRMSYKATKPGLVCVFVS